MLQPRRQPLTYPDVVDSSVNPLRSALVCCCCSSVVEACPSIREPCSLCWPERRQLANAADLSKKLRVRAPVVRPLAATALDNHVSTCAAQCSCLGRRAAAAFSALPLARRTALAGSHFWRTAVTPTCAYAAAIVSASSPRCINTEPRPCHRSVFARTSTAADARSVLHQLSDNSELAFAHGVRQHGVSFLPSLHLAHRSVSLKWGRDGPQCGTLALT